MREFLLSISLVFVSILGFSQSNNTILKRTSTGQLMVFSGIILQYVPIEESESSPPAGTSLDLDSLAYWNFDDMDLGRVDEAESDAYFNSPGSSPNCGVGNVGYDTTCFIVDNGLGDFAWRSVHDSLSYGLIDDGTGTNGGGFLLYLPTGNPSDSTEIYFSYNFRFREDYYAAKAGKLPGLKSSNESTEFLPCDGFTMNLSFTGDSSEYYQPTAEGVAFYFTNYNMDEDDLGNVPDPPLTCGEAPDIDGSIYAILDSLGGLDYIKLRDAHAGLWQNITLRMVMNSTTSTPDGFTEIFVNGLLCQRVEGMLLDRGISGTEFDQIKFNWFFGGNAEEHRAERDEWAEFDDIWTFRYGSSYTGVPRGNNFSDNGRILDLPNGSRNEDGSWTKELR